MGDVVIVDTSVFLNVLDVPEFNDDRDDFYRQFEQFLEEDATLILPLATVFETGGHIADVKDGGNRRHFAEVFCDKVTEAREGKAPWRLVSPRDNDQLARWLKRFPDCAMQEISLSDLSLMDLWESLCKKLFETRVLIWSLDGHLSACDRKP